MKSESRDFYATLGVRSTRLDAGEIGRILQTPPTRTVTKGDPVSRRNPDGPRRPAHIWYLRTSLNSSEIEDHIRYLLEFAESKSAQFQDELKDCGTDIWCFLSPAGDQLGFGVDVDLMRRLSAAKLDLVFDIYPQRPGVYCDHD